MTLRWLTVGVLIAAFAAPPAPAQTNSTAPPEEHHEHKAKVASASLTISAAGKSVIYKLADLQAMPQRTLIVHNGHSGVDETYSGVGLSDLLAKAGYNADAAGQKRVLHSYLRAEGTDKYFVIFSAAELEPALHSSDSIVALTLNGQPLGEDGQFKMVIEGEKKPARWVTNLSSIIVVTLE